MSTCGKDTTLGIPANGLASITVTGDRLTMTDAFATAAFAKGESAQDWLETLDGPDGVRGAPAASPVKRVGTVVAERDPA